ncbi:NAD(P)-dependent oxidoreductase [Paracoccus aminophilus]|uniref:NAD-dependent epimerase/dehydratase n=1 Tax=Paracoccus aminophilus JCM 7686 TaxID=1367847 RepID=S5YZS3_PARAH|nr:NAD(P)H-binding protein [Paracoccus aminophilus]AGT10711.1 NAD-dependent epimerase/dehydratase [Paracoccus aminophilus JCM 7686]
MAKIVLIGASGGIGSHLRTEALARGHHVTALTRSQNLPAAERLTSVQADLAETAAVTEIFRGADAVLSAYSPGLSRFSAEEAAQLIKAAHESLFTALNAAGVARAIIVGGVGSLRAEADRDGDVVDAAFYPADHKAHTLQNREILRGLRGAQGAAPATGSGLDWSYVSPPLDIFEGPKLGRYRLGQDVLLRDAAGDSRISRADFAAAILDVFEKGSHIRERFTVAY